MKRDIETRDDIELFLKAFYSRALQHEVLKSQFVHLNMAHHIPIITNFWSSLIFFDQSYDGNPFIKHKEMQLNKEHFVTWLHLFHQTMDEMYAGERANEMKKRADSIAQIFQYKLGITPVGGDGS
jgi:hemoglobin